MAEPKFRPPPVRRTLPLAAADTQQFEFKVHKEKARTGKQLFRDKLLSDQGLRCLYEKVRTDPTLIQRSSKDPLSDVKRVLWHVRDWQNALFPRMKFPSFVNYTALMKTYKHDIEQTLNNVSSAPEPTSNEEKETQKDGVAPSASAVGAAAEYADEFDCEEEDPADLAGPTPADAPADPPPSTQITYFRPKTAAAPPQAADAASAAGGSGGEGDRPPLSLGGKRPAEELVSSSAEEDAGDSGPKRQKLSHPPSESDLHHPTPRL
eukprot:EG_transcript_20684